jgi:3'(2'), 5'-bisphosphate nucleotidase
VAKINKDFVIMNYVKERQFAIDSVLKACGLCRRVLSALVSQDTITKNDRSPVTVADFGGQALISEQLKNTFPDDLLVGEENADLLREKENKGVREAVFKYVQEFSRRLGPSEMLEAIDRGSGDGGPEGRFWTVDPIDGTKGFLRGDQFAVALALVEDGEVVLGVLGCPNLPLNGLASQDTQGSLFVAVKGEGAFIREFENPDEHAIGVSPLTDPREAIFCESFESSHSSHGDTARVAQQLGISKPSVRMDSLCKYAIVARGDATFYLRIPSQKSYVEKIWDHAAGYIIVQEAGGKVTDIEGKPLDFATGRLLSNNKGIIASNGRLHGHVLEAMKNVT